MDLRHWTLIGLSMEGGCSADLKPGLYGRDSQAHPYVDDDYRLSLAYRVVTDVMYVAILDVDPDYLDISLVEADNLGIGSDGRSPDYWWDEDVFYRCSRVAERLLCVATMDGEVLYGTVNNNRAITLFGSGGVATSMNIEEFSLGFTEIRPNPLDEEGRRDWDDLQSDFAKWLSE